MSSGEDSYEEEFEQEDNQSEEGDEDYDVLPGAKPAAPARLPKPSQPVAVPARRAATAGAPGNRAPLSAPKPLAIPTPPPLSDAELAARRFRLDAARKKMGVVKQRMQVVRMDDMFLMSQLSLYDMFSMGRGVYSGLVPKGCQTNDDAKEEGMQTDEIPNRTYACQAPDDRSHLTESDVTVETAPSSSGRPTQNGVSASSATSSALGGAAAQAFPVQDPMVQKKLAAFMQWAGPLVLASLGIAPSQKSLSFSPPRNPGGLSEGLTKLSWDALLANRPVTTLAFCPAPTEPSVLVAYGPVGAQLGAAADLIKDHSLASKGCLCLWDLSTPSRPQHVMFSEGSPTCCAFAPAPSTHVVVAGMAEGGVCVWDLEELPVRHPTEIIAPLASDTQPLQDQGQQGEEIVARRPSYTTEGQPGSLDDDNSTVGAIVAVATAPKEGGRNSPCTVAALTEWGEVQVYTCSFLTTYAGSNTGEMDLGMRIGSRVRLMRNGGTVRLGMQALKLGAQLQIIPSYSLAILGSSAPSDGAAAGDKQGAGQLKPATLRSISNQVLVGSEGGKVLKGGWAGTVPAPKLYLTDDHKSQAAAMEPDRTTSILSGAVTCVAVSPAQPLAFLSGTSDGSVSLHRVDRSSAVAVWPSLGSGGHSIRSLSWIPSKPACFLALDAACMLHCFDLAKSQSGPVSSESFIVQNSSLPAFPTVLAAAALRPSGLAAPPTVCFALGQDDGGVEVHRLSANVGAGQGGGMEREEGLAALNSVLGFVGSAGK